MSTNVVRRIMVVGASGSGKSTVARALGAEFGLPVIHLDAEFWRPGWIEPDHREFEMRVAALAATEKWVIDGQYSKCWECRAVRADLIVWLDLPRRVYFWRVVKRTLMGLGRVRADLGSGCPERVDPAFLHYVWNYPRRSRRAMIERLQRESGRRITVALRSQREIDNFVASLAPATARHLGIPDTTP